MNIQNSEKIRPVGGKIRQLVDIHAGQATRDGDGVQIRRYIGTPELEMLDPILMLDKFGSDQPQDYIGGFPDHPHRGFETVTYLLAGRMRHWDNAGHEGVIEPGDIQWMSAGRGIIHSEMPEQENGLLHGFQIWINLPAKDKMNPPAYQEYHAADIPVDRFEHGEAKIIAGVSRHGVHGLVVDISSDPIFMDVSLDSAGQFSQTVSASHSGIVYMIDGAAQIGGQELSAGMLGVLGEGELVDVNANVDCRFLILAARQLNEPVARGGPFVMNTRKELLQAFDDYKNGRF